MKMDFKCINAQCRFMQDAIGGCERPNGVCPDYACCNVVVEYTNTPGKSYMYMCNYIPEVGDTLNAYPRGEYNRVEVTDVITKPFSTSKHFVYASSDEYKLHLKRKSQEHSQNESLKEETTKENQPMKRLTILSKTKDDIIRAQVGSAVIESIKQGIETIPMTDKLRAIVLKEGWSDAVIGTVLAEVVGLFSKDGKVLAACECARAVGLTRASEQVNSIKFIADRIRVVVEGLNAINSISGEE